MILVKLQDDESKRKALAFLAGRFSFKSWANGDLVVPDAALAYLAHEGVRFTVEGPATYERLIPSVRDAAAPAV
jgi:hypothetical protein